MSKQAPPQEIIQMLLEAFNAAMEHGGKKGKKKPSLDLWPFLTMDQRMQMQQRGFTPNSLNAWFGGRKNRRNKRYV